MILKKLEEQKVEEEAEEVDLEERRLPRVLVLAPPRPLHPRRRLARPLRARRHRRPTLARRRRVGPLGGII